jgi:sporulation protein YlmC with PRC-barrel domain
MNKSVLALTTALSIFAASSAFAQNTAPATADPLCVDPATNMVKMNDPNCNADGSRKDAMGTTGTAPATGTTTTTTGQTGTTGTDTTTTGSTAPADQTQMQSGSAPMSTDLIVPADRFTNAKVMSASDYIGKTVYDTTGANIGEVNDLIVSENGQINAVILGVGGFLGIGEKNVAVSIPSVQMVQDGNTMRLVVEATKDQLEAAPSYDMTNRRYTSAQ